jgi:predicted aspartyl protease
MPNSIKICAASAAIVLAAAGGAGAQQASKCHLQQVAALPVGFHHNRPLVEVSINGKPARMLLDTGAGKTILFKAPALAMGLNPVGSDILFEGVGGVRAALEVTVGRFGLGDTTASNLRLFVLDGDVGDGAVGVLGQDLLSKTDVEFDLAHATVRLFDEKDCGTSNLAYWTKEPEVADLEGSGPAFLLPLVLNGTTVHALLDSGAEVSAATSAAAARVGGQRQVEKAGSINGVGASKVETATVTFASLKIGDEEIKQARLTVGDYFRAAREDAPTDSHIKTASSDAIEVMLGADFLRSHRVFLSRHQKRAYFTYAGGPVFQVVAPPTDAEPEKAKP